ncbi:uncharacterized protein LJ206_011467 [Theristicus caerulescens]
MQMRAQDVNKSKHCQKDFGWLMENGKGMSPHSALGEPSPKTPFWSSEVQSGEKCRQPVPPAQASPAPVTPPEVFGLWPREEKHYTGEQPFRATVRLEPSFQRGFRKR